MDMSKWDKPKKPSKCHTCDTEKHLKLADAGVCAPIYYWYCKGCKNEVDKDGLTPGTIYTISDLEAELSAWMDEASDYVLQDGCLVDSTLTFDDLEEEII